MAQRQTDEQAEHDLVIQAAADQFASSAKYAIHTNPGIEKRAGLGHQYPDIVVTEKGSANVRFVIEVETMNTIEASEVSHWHALAGLGPPLYLVVPHLSLPIAEQLCAKAGIKCRFGYFHKDDMGRLRVVLKKDTVPQSTAAKQADLRARFAAMCDRQDRPGQKPGTASDSTAPECPPPDGPAAG
jgi:hypothetical protein